MAALGPIHLATFWRVPGIDQLETTKIQTWNFPGNLPCWLYGFLHQKLMIVARTDFWHGKNSEDMVQNLNSREAGRSWTREGPECGKFAIDGQQDRLLFA